MRCWWIVFAVCAAAAVVWPPLHLHGEITPSRLVDLTGATIVTAPNAESLEKKAAQFLTEEVQKRTGLRWPITARAESGRPTIYLASIPRLPAILPGTQAKTFGSDLPPDGFTLRIEQGRSGARVIAAGSDSRGTLYAAGRLLRMMEMEEGKVLARETELTTVPAKRLRGHQIGWRPKSNTYDRWGLAEYEQYVRDVLVWGANAIELIPLDPDGDFERSLDFNARLADMIASYGLEVWLWYPFDDRIPAALRGDKRKPGDEACPSEPDERAFLLERRRAWFKRFKRLDAVFIPGGDPGGCSCDKCRPWPNTLLPLAGETAALLRESHPHAQLWISNQGFHGPENDAFYAFLAAKPVWLTGIVYAPWAEESLESMRKRAPEPIPIRAYPDITHTVRCQYPARDWDNAFALTLDREPPIYRPVDSVSIARLSAASTVGAITYSDGVNDDLNKAIWSAVMWDPTVSPGEIVRDYARCNFGAGISGQAGEGLLALERNWIAPLAENRSVPRTLRLWQSLEESQPKLARGNWRFQMALLRAYYDAYVQRKLAADSGQVERALQALRPYAGRSFETAIREALSELREKSASPAAADLKSRLLTLGQALHDSIGMQLSVGRWGASGDERGAILDHLDRPLADQDWLTAELARISTIPDPDSRRTEIERLIAWENAGPGGLYDDLGNPGRQPHLVRELPWDRDPGYLVNPRVDFRQPLKNGRQSWNSYAEALYDSPILVRYSRLDRHARYRVRAVEGGRYNPVMRLSADGIEVHRPIATAGPPRAREWPIPPAATADGSLTLRWDRVEGRGAQVCEVWLVRDR